MFFLYCAFHNTESDSYDKRRNNKEVRRAKESNRAIARRNYKE